MDPGQRNGRRRRRIGATLAPALIGGALLAAVVAGQPAAAQSARAASVVPNGLFTDLVKLDRKLARLIHDEREGLPFGQTTSRVHQIHRAKLRMVDQFFGQEVYGVKFSEVFDKLDCLDVLLENGRLQDNPLIDHPDHAVAAFEEGKKCKQKLEAELHKAGGVPDALFTDLVHIDRKLARLIHDEREGLPFGQTTSRVHQIHRAKLRMVDQFFGQEVYGVKFSEVFDKLDCLDVLLENGRLQDNPLIDHPDHAVAAFEEGKKCKQQLETDLHKANQQPQCTGHAMLGNIYGGQAHELVADFTCPKPSTEFSLTVPAGYQITGGQASNAASGGGYSCSLNATSTTVDCIGNSPPGSTTYVQMTTSPNPQAGMVLPLKVSFSDSSTTSFTLTSH